MSFTKITVGDYDIEITEEESCVSEVGVRSDHGFTRVYNPLFRDVIKVLVKELVTERGARL